MRYEKGEKFIYIGTHNLYKMTTGKIYEIFESGKHLAIINDMNQEDFWPSVYFFKLSEFLSEE